ncbi:MAG: hypothetical protein IJX58_07945 [Clostridia bacterium]|nr:hypothetical protein [Clostridia bacterium]
MKTEFKIFALVIVLSVTTLCLGSFDDFPKHEHNYSSEWSFDEINHWHASICDVEEDCALSVFELGVHIFADGNCSVCGYADPSFDGNGNNEDDNVDKNPDDSKDDTDIDNGNDNTEDGDGIGDGDGDNDDNDDKDDPGVTVCQHNYSSEQTKAPTCTENGENLFTCSLCGDSYTESIAANGHTEIAIPGVIPTCTESGLSGGKQCSICGEITKAQIEISPKGHSFSEGICSDCGATDPDFEVPVVNYIHTATTNNYCWVDKVSFTASESGEYTFIMPSGLGAWDADDWRSGKKGPVIDALHPNYIPGEFSFTIPIAEGATYEFYIGAVERREWTIGWTFVACEVEVDDENSDEPVNADLAIGNNLIDGHSIIYTYKAASDGTLTLTLSSIIDGSVEASYSLNGSNSLDFLPESSISFNLTEGDEVVITVIADGYASLDVAWTGEVVEEPEEEDPFVDFSGEYKGTDAFGNQLLTVIIDSPAATVEFKYYHPLTGPNNVKATYKIRGGEVTLYDESGKKLHPLAGTLVLVNGIPSIASFDGTQYSLSLGIPESGGSGDGDGEIVIKGEMIDCEENTFNITLQELAADKIYVTFVPVYDGVYDFFSDHIFVDTIMYEDGTPAEKNEYDFYVLKSYVTYIVKINLEYIAHIGNYTITPAYQYPEGHSKNPIWYTLGENCTAEYKGDYHPVWYQFYADVTGTLTVTSKKDGVTVMIAAIPDFDVAAIETLSLDVVQGRKYYIGIAAYDSTEPVAISFKASILEGEITTDGTINIPHIFELGNTEIDIPALEGRYFVYKSTGNGTLKLSANSAGFTWCLTDFSEPAYTNDAEISTHLELGDLVYIYIEADAEITEPVSFTASFTDDAKQKWVYGPFVLDGSQPNVIRIDERTYALMQIGGTIGQFKVSWDNPNATVLVNNNPLENGGTIYVTDVWFGPYLKIYLSDYQSGVVNLMISPV